MLNAKDKRPNAGETAEAWQDLPPRKTSFGWMGCRVNSEEKQNCECKMQSQNDRSTFPFTIRTVDGLITVLLEFLLVFVAID
jgi:hypothetical protein